MRRREFISLLGGATGSKLITYRPALDPAGDIPWAPSSWTREG
jgi:hypothetical protein